jgi:elongation factor P
MRASDIKRGQASSSTARLYVVTNADHNTPGNLRAKVQFKMRDVLKGTIQDKRVGATDDIETTTLDSRTVEYLYSDNDGHVLMDLETYDQSTDPQGSVRQRHPLPQAQYADDGDVPRWEESSATNCPRRWT